MSGRKAHKRYENHTRHKITRAGALDTLESTAVPPGRGSTADSGMAWAPSIEAEASRGISEGSQADMPVLIT